MKIKGTQTTRTEVQVDVDPYTLMLQLDMDMRRLYCIPADAYLNEKNQMVCEERNWRHGSVGTDMLDPNPTEDTIAVLNAIHNFRSLYHNALQLEAKHAK